MDWIETEGGPLRVESTGEGAGVPLLLVHGGGGDRSHWARLLPLLTGRQVVTYDQRGYGESPRRKNGADSLTAMARDTVAVADALGLERPVLVGHSFGGSVVAEAVGARPDRFAGAVFLDAAGDLRGLPPDAVTAWRQDMVPEKFRASSRARFEQALGILKTLPESEDSLEQAFEITLELRPVLRQLGEGRQMIEYLREAEALAERLKDDRRRGLVCAFMTTVQSTLDKLDEALMTGTRALEIASRLGDLRLRILATSHLEQAYYYRGEYERVVESATGNLATLPANWVKEYFGMAVPASIFSRAWLIMSLAELGRFAEAARYEAETMRIAEPTQHAFTIGWAHFAASMPYLLRGEWAKARLRVEHWIAMLRTGNVAIHLPWAVASSAWALAQIGEAREALGRVQEAEQLLERQAARGIVGHRGWAYHAMGHACLLLGRVDEARRLGDRAFESSQHQPGFAAHALRLLGDIASHADRLDFERGIARYLEALALAEAHGMRPLVAHCHLGLGKLYRRSDPQRARENLTIATTMYREMDMDFGLKQREVDMMNFGDAEVRVRSAAKILGSRP